MVEMIPNYIDQENPRLNGERQVFNMLRNSKYDGIALHSLWQKNQTHKLMGEVDFLLITPNGLLCIEVKGGYNIYRKDGVWYSVDRNNSEHKIKNPFKQAQECMYALKKQLKDTKFKNALVGLAVAFPECYFTGQGNDLLTEVLFDASEDNFDAYIKRVYEYWFMRYKETNNFTCRNLNENDIKDLKKILRGNFAVIPAMGKELENISNEIIRLTEEQYEHLNNTTEDNDRVMIKGVAGTGKSILAIEKAKQLMSRGLKTAYICFNRNMGNLAELSIGEIPQGSFVGTIHRLLLNENSNINVEDSLSDICSDFIKNANIKEKFDALIIDEAQDLMNYNIIDALSLFLKGGLENGKWIILFDPNQNIFQPMESFDETFKFLKEFCRPAIVSLNVNCRNTKQIAEKVSKITKVESAQYKNINGAEVVLKTFESNNDCISELRKQIQSLLTGGVKANNIVILSKYKKENSILKDISSLCGFLIKEMNNISYENKNMLKYYTVQSFKGLESDIVFYIDIDGFERARDRMINYVALSRAKSFLYVFFNKSLNKEFFEFIFNNN